MDRQRARLLLEMERQALLRMAMAERGGSEGDARGDILGEPSAADQHQADRGTETFDRRRGATILQIAREHNADIEHALAKLAAGSYGTCETCGTVISVARLEARPEARFCEAHERMREFDLIPGDERVRQADLQADEQDEEQLGP